MKHIKTYEHHYHYKVGEYVRINLWNEYLSGEIIKVEYKDPIPYLLILSTGKMQWATEYMITRNLNEEEIEEFKTKMDSKKYNL